MSGDALVYGLHAVESVLRTPGRVREAWLDEGRRDQRLRGLAAQLQDAGVPHAWVRRERLDELACGERHQGAVARVRPAQSLNESHLEQLLVQLQEPAFLLVLDGVQDPHNLGACLRSADAAGVHAVIAPRDRACGLTATVRKVAVGAAETVPFVQVTNLARTLRMLRDNGVRIVGTAGETETSLFQADLTGPLALVLGAEEKGLRRLTREHCDQLVRIPMRGSVESLNVSVATGISLFEALRQRLPS
ncbi:MAG: 23S rRNA (guanosine(2251)-2'-O)-methyltransferase RlmB [Gammaproteobacteria bacterium]|nr:23S rRNA (guanosine(2251)-2'-O)-methyltransferase RlmB [Gammaproteobacteria bacterium]